MDNLNVNTLYYLSTIDKYLGRYGIYSPEEVMEGDRLEKKWKESRSRLSTYQLLEIFPEAKPTVKRILKEQIKQYKADLNFANEWETKFNNNILSRVKMENKWFYAWIRDFLLEPLREDKESLIKKNYFLLSSLNPQAKELKGKITDHDIAHAKTIPIENYYFGHLYKRGNTLVGVCPFHTDKGPSFTIYTNTNRFWCFGCSAGTDVIDYIMKKNNCSFLDAVKTILNK